MEDGCELREAYALGILEAEERAHFEAHLDAGCPRCEARLREEAGLVGRLSLDWSPVPPSPDLRDRLLDLAQAPSLPLDLEAIEWEELAEGIRVHVMREDPARGLRGCLVWARDGARHPRHRHLGDENILVLEGALRDHRGTYGPGQVCYSRRGSIHAEEVVPGEDCICYVVYYGDLELLDPPERQE